MSFTPIREFQDRAIAWLLESVEHEGLERGREEGELIGQRNFLSMLLAEKFSEKTDAEIQEVLGGVTDKKQLAFLLSNREQFQTWDEFCSEIARLD